MDRNGHTTGRRWEPVPYGAWQTVPLIGLAVVLVGCLSSRPYQPTAAFEPSLDGEAQERARAEGEALGTVDCQRGVRDAEAAERFVYWAFEVGDEPAQAAAVECAEALLQGSDQAPATTRVRRATALLVPEGRREAVLTRPDAGAALFARIRDLDPAPATPENERFTEHLARLSYAHYRYADADSPTGLDPRGELYVRLGAPSGYKSVDFYTTELLRRIRDLQSSVHSGLTVSPSEFADNEFWLYEDPEPFFYLFVDDGAGFRQGDVIDLIPARFRSGLDGSTGRGGAKADVLLEVFRAVFRQLSPYAVEYGVQFNEVDAYLGEMEALFKRAQAQAEFAPVETRERRVQRLDFSAVYAQNQDIADGARASADYVVRQTLAEARRVEEEVQARRAEVAPTERSTLYRPPLPLFARVARFLGPLGQTQVLAYWPEPAGGTVERARVVVMDPARRVLADAFLGAGPRRVGWEGGSDGHPLAVQVERAGETYVAHLDPAAPLLYGTAVEMSDVVPFRADDVMDAGESLRDGLGRSRVSPYPGPSLAGLAGIGLYAEAYLPVGGADVLVTYTVETRREGGLFRRPSRQESEQQFFRQSESRVLPVAFLVDRAAWEGADEVRLTVRVEDLDSEEAVERSIRFSTR
jgi:hypothetical protein